MSLNSKLSAHSVPSHKHHERPRHVQPHMFTKNHDRVPTAHLLLQYR